MVLEYPHLLEDATHPLIKSPSGRILNPISMYRIFQWGQRFGTQYSPVPLSLPSSTTTIASLAWPGNHAKESRLWYLGSAARLLVLTYIPGSPPLACATWGAGWRCPLAPPGFHLNWCSDTHEPYVPSPHIQNIWSHYSHIPCHCSDCCLDPWYYVDFYYHSLHLPTVEGCWLKFSKASVPPVSCMHNLLTQIWNVILPLWLSQGQSSCSDSDLKGCYQSWGYIILWLIIQVAPWLIQLLAQPM